MVIIRKYRSNCSWSNTFTSIIEYYWKSKFRNLNHYMVDSGVFEFIGFGLFKVTYISFIKVP